MLRPAEPKDLNEDVGLDVDAPVMPPVRGREPMKVPEDIPDEYVDDPEAWQQKYMNPERIERWEHDSVAEFGAAELPRGAPKLIRRSRLTRCRSGEDSASDR
jgi:hypothetical protein